MSIGRSLLYVASAGAIALCARSVLVGPISLPIAAAAITLYLAILLSGDLPDDVVADITELVDLFLPTAVVVAPPDA